VSLLHFWVMRACNTGSLLDEPAVAHGAGFVHVR
jgi:hypothetical protein